jgi:hypothetical protein
MMTKLAPFLSRIEKEETVYFRNVIISNKKVAETHTRLKTRFLQTLSFNGRRGSYFFSREKGGLCYYIYLFDLMLF